MRDHVENPEELRRIAARLIEMAEAIEGKPQTNGLATPSEKIISTGRAAAISGRSYSSLYRDAKAGGFGWKLPTGAWAFSEAHLRDYYRRKMNRGEFGEVGECERIVLASVRAQINRT